MALLKFITDRPVMQDAGKLRGFIAKHYEKIPDFHHHSGSDFDYSHPLIQYKIVNEQAFITGIKRGAVLLHLVHNFEKISLGGEQYLVNKQEIEIIPVEIHAGNKDIHYKFLTPWLALNEENYTRYLELSPQEQTRLLERILVGNILSFSKKIGYTVEKHIRAKGKFKAQQVKLKNVTMIGFLGEFRVNFHIPDYWGLGKSVSRGFGTIKRIEPCS